MNPNAIHILKQNPLRINWVYLCCNPNAIDMIEPIVHTLQSWHWVWLSSNSNAIDIIERNLDKVSWVDLCSNPNAIHLLENNIDKIDWGVLFTNPSAISIIEKNMDKVIWYALCRNPNAMHLITDMDYSRMKDQMKDFRIELCEYIYRPDRIDRLRGDMSFQEYVQMI